MYVKYVGEVDTSVWNDEGRKIAVDTGMIFKTSTKSGESYLRSKQFEEASIAEFESQKKKPQVVEQAPVQEAPVAEPVAEETETAVEEAPVAELKSKKK